jgi:cytosolic iron-sulfur protein assembly protein CIAO1
VWDIDKNDVWHNVCTLSGQFNRTIYSISVSRNGVVATGSGDDYIRVFELDTEDADPSHPVYYCSISKEKAHGSDVNSVAWNPVDSSILASCGDDNFVKIWSVEL